MKQTKSLGLVVLVALSLFVVCAPVVNAQGTVVSTESAVLNDVGDVVQIRLWASEFPDGLSGYRIRIEFDSSVVNITNVVFPSWATLHQIPEQGPGYIVIKAADLTKQVEAGATNVTLATLEVQALDYGTSPLNITIEQMDDDHGNPIEPTTQPGQIKVNYPPIATFEIYTLTNITNVAKIDEEVTFDASGSYDPDGSIVQYTWDFGDGTILNTTKPRTTHAYTSPGNYTITLTIKDNDGKQQSVSKSLIVVKPVKLLVIPLVKTISKGVTSSISLVASEFPDGLSGYRIRIEFDSSVVNITNVVFPSWATLHQIPEQGPGYIVIKAADLTKQVEAGATNVTLATLEVYGVDIGNSSITIIVEQIDSDTGTPILTEVTNGFIQVIPLRPLPGYGTPTDPDGDGLYEDLNGNGRIDFNDVVLLFQYMEFIQQNWPVSVVDFNGNGRLDFDDIVVFFQTEL